MASAAIFSSHRRRSPSPEDLEEVALIDTLAAVASEIEASFSGRTVPFQRRNSRSLVRKVEVFVVLLEYLRDSSSIAKSISSLSPTAILCFKELYMLLYRSKMLLDYCFNSSKLWLLLQHQIMSGHFHDLNQEISTLLDVFPLNELDLSDDIREQIELLQKQSRRSIFLIDKQDEALRMKLFSFLDKFENGRIPDPVELYSFFVEKLGIRGSKSFRVETEFLEEQIVNHEGDVEPAVLVLDGFVALTRYSRFLLFGFEEDEVELRSGKQNKPKKGLLTREIAETYLIIPKDFCCPISLDLMRNPVIISTGQTYDRSSISRWIEEGHYTCPKTGQMLVDTRLVPNLVLRNLIMQWCTAHGIPCDPPENAVSSAETFAAASASKAAVEANKATVALLIQQLASGSEGAKAIAALEIRLLAKTGRENRAYIAEAGAIPHLNALLLSSNVVAQENSVTAMLNLSIYDKNKSRIMDEEGCLGCIVQVLRFGYTTEARENAAATLFSLSAVHNYKKKIADEEGTVEALAGLLREGTPRGKKDAVTALFNLSTHTDNCMKMIESGAVTALVGALGVEGVAEEAAGALALIFRQPIGAGAVGDEEMAVAGLIGMMRCGTPRAKENAVAALLELCRSGGAAATEKVLKAPALAGLLQTLLFTGTKRARRKAASLARVFQRCENASLHFGGMGVDYAFARNAAANRDTSFAGDMPVQMSISVPVL
ncbi:U-box domain-containing protein [Actinidia chinensis var. chinensis]|uniref:RING-type E3 ubiquitin transferase n=1 Tax=Actinidia chinensis var. chinensis TaxID=1590841 RepID=A0A2R6RG76_ACTCC|nr:U-box domain-containing protein [Actinidia chinensis var. chinensis]